MTEALSQWAGSSDDSTAGSEEIGAYYLYDGAHLYNFVRSCGLRVGPSVLNVGCAGGADARHLRGLGAERLVGVEPVAAAARRARMHYDEVFDGTLDDFGRTAQARFSTVIFADSLEHMVDPRSALRVAAGLLDPDGLLLLSLPNVRHLSVLYRLAVRGDWRYEPAGILDETHLRFFTSKSATRLLQNHGFQIQAMARWGAMSMSRRVARYVPRSGEFLLSQMVFAARRSGRVY